MVKKADPKPEEKKHSEFSASGSKRWLNCPGSLALSKDALKAPDSKYAAEGTLAHECLESFIKNKADSSIVLQTLLKKHPKEMVYHAHSAYAEINKLRSQYPTAEFLCETKVSLEFIEPDMFGTVDAAIVEMFGRLIVIDFKYGAGIAVDPRDNPQLAYYALGLSHMYGHNFTEVEFIIIQPRAMHPDGPTRRYVMPIEELSGFWHGAFSDGVVTAKKKDAPLHSGEWCQFCPAKYKCPEIGKKALKQAQVEFDVIDSTEIILPEPSKHMMPNLSNVLDACIKLEKWIDGVREHAQTVIQMGETIPGYKLVNKRPTRKWCNEESVAEEAREIWGKKAFKTEFLSPAQFEKQIGEKDWVNERTSSESSGVTLVKDSDKRQPIMTAAQEFDVVEIEETSVYDISEIKKRLVEGGQVTVPQKTQRRHG